MKKIIIRNTIGLLFGLGVLYIINSIIIDKQIDISVVISLLCVVSYFTYFDLRRIEKENKEVFNGVSMLNNGDSFIFDNMIIRKFEGKYIVHYLLLWNENTPENKNTNIDYLTELKTDFSNLLKNNKKLNNLLKDQIIDYSIVNNLGEE